MRRVFVFLILLSLAVFFAWQSVYLPSAPGSEKGILFTVEEGEGSKEIALNLEKESLIRWGPIFRGYVLLKGVSKNLQAGIYLLSPSMNIPAIVAKFVSGDVAKEKITIIEGWTLKDIGFYFENKGMFQAEELYDEMPELEGYLFPDTYWIKRGASLKEIVAKMKANFQEKTKDLEITPEIVIMASLLEKEVRTFEDKKIVSGILWKRLENRILLQVDAEMWTYQNYGLPPGPIANPGLDSILAALYPEKSDYWYYLSTPEGETIFSKTLEEHNIAKAKYLR